MFDAAKRIGQIRAIEAKIGDIEKKHKEELAPFKEFAEKARGEVISFLLATNQQNAKTEQGTGYLVQKLSYSIKTNPAEFRRHVIGSESWHLADWKANKTGVDAFRLEHGGRMEGGRLIGGDMPPGVTKSEEITLGVLKPDKPKTVAATTHGSPALDEDARKLEAMGQDAGPTFETL